MDEELKQYLDAMKGELNGKLDRAAEAFASEVGGLHSELKALDRRLVRIDGNTITTMELLTRQSRWHEESDNAVRDLTVRQTEFAHTLEELKGRVADLEQRKAS